MKILKTYIALVAITAMLFTSCSKDEAEIKTQDPSSENFAELSLGAMLTDFTNRAALKQSIPDCSLEDPAYAHVEITHNEGNDLEGTIEVNVPIIEEDGAYFTDYNEDLEIPVINDDDKTALVSLTSFVIFDGDPDDAGSTAIWIAPASESDYGNFVNQGLPYDFTMRAGSKKYVDVEVLCFDDRDVNLYGYQFFDLIPEVLHEVCVFANYCNDSGRHFTADYSLDITYIGGDEEIDLHTNLTPETGEYGDDFYAEPTCFSVPAPMYGEDDDDNYLRITATLENWDDNYTSPGEEMTITRDISWADIEEHFEGNSSVDYFHLFFNCGDDDEDGDGDDGDGDDNGDDDGDEDNGSFACDYDTTVACGDFYLNGSNDLIQSTESGAFYLSELGDGFSERVATVTMQYQGEDEIFYFINLREGYTLYDYRLIVYSDDSESNPICITETGLETTGNLAAEGSIDGDDLEGYSGTFHATLVANICD